MTRRSLRHSMAIFGVASTPLILIDWIYLVLVSPTGSISNWQNGFWLYIATAGFYLCTAGLLGAAIWAIRLPGYRRLSSISDWLLRHSSVRRLIQIGIAIFCLSAAVLLVRVFQDRYHDEKMITWSLFILNGFITWIAVISIIILQKPSVVTRNNLTLRHPLLFPGYVISLALLFNLSWIRHVIDLKALTMAALWLLLVCKTWERIPDKSWLRKTAVIIWVIALLSIPVTAVMISHRFPLLKQFSILPSYTVNLMERSGFQQWLDQRLSPAKPATAPPLPENFDRAEWNQMNRQNFDYLPETSNLTGLGKNWNVILLSIDALRADHLSGYGYRYNTSPVLDSLADNGVLFERHYTQGGDSIYSLNSVLSGVLPWNYREQKHPLLSHILSESGYRTIYVGYDYVLKGGAFRQGFEENILLDGDRSEIWGTTTSHTLIDGIISMVHRDDPRPFFLYCHLLDPHADYVTNSETARFSDSSHPGYDGEIAFTDKEIGRLINDLKQHSIWDQTLLIVTADHGEAFNEHGHLWHGRYLYDESVRTPLIMNLPELTKRRVKIPVGPVNIAPTILDFVGVTIPEYVQGTSLLPTAYQGVTHHLPVVEMYIPREKYSKRGWVYGPWKLIENTRQKTRELYHLGNDPRELNNLFSSSYPSDFTGNLPTGDR